MGTPTFPSTPPDTDSWVEGVTHGYFGERTDPLPDEVYGPTFGVEDITPDLTAVSPNAQDTGIDGPWTMTCTGTFPILDTDMWWVVIVAADGSEWTSLDVTEPSIDTLTAHFMGGPHYPAAGGAGHVVVRNGNVDMTPTVPFTWNYTAVE